MTSFSGESLKANATGPHTGFSARGASSDELRMGNQRLEHAPVEDHRQATTRAALKGAIHVQFHSTNEFRQMQSKLITIEDAPKAEVDSKQLWMREPGRCAWKPSVTPLNGELWQFN
jgi:hypothetical protein